MRDGNHCKLEQTSIIPALIQLARSIPKTTGKD